MRKSFNSDKLEARGTSAMLGKLVIHRRGWHLRVVVTITTVLAALIAAGDLPGHLSQPRPAVAEANPPQVPGIGETVVLVIGGFFTDQVAATASPGASGLGDVEGLYVANTADYTLLGVYEQTSGDTILIPCTTVNSTNMNTSCDPVATPNVEVHPAEHVLHYLGSSGILTLQSRQAAQAAAAGSCGYADGPSCVSGLIQRLNGTTGTFMDPVMTATAFRTRQGAQEFVAMSRAFGIGPVVTVRALKTGGGLVGLGQEARPDGSGRLEAPLPNADSFL